MLLHLGPDCRPSQSGRMRCQDPAAPLPLVPLRLVRHLGNQKIVLLSALWTPRIDNQLCATDPNGVLSLRKANGHAQSIKRVVAQSEDLHVSS